MKRLVVLTVVVAIMPFRTMAGTKVTGTILDCHGKPLPLAHAHLLPYRGNLHNPLLTCTADKKGRFSLEVAEPGMYRLLLTGVGHDHVAIPLLLESEHQEISVSVHLAPLPYKERFELVRILGDWDKFNWQTADTMQAQPDGTFLYEREISADTVAYQLLEITTVPRSVNGTSSDWFRYDGGGDYISVLRTRDGRARIVFHPKKLPVRPVQTLPAVQFRRGDGTLRALWSIYAVAERERLSFQLALRRYSQDHEDTAGFTYDWAAPVAQLKEYLNPEYSTLVRRFAAVQLVGLAPFGARLDSTTLGEIVQLLPADSPMWSLQPQAALMVHRSREVQEAFLQAVAEQNPDRLVRAQALAVLASMAQFKKDSTALATYYAKLEKDYADVQEVQHYLKMLNPRTRIAKGKPVPDFSVELIEGGQRLTNVDLRGKFYLLDFWATWCGPCVGEMPHLHQAYERFKDKGFVILSLSLDRAPEDVARFRQKRWAMPWLHAFLAGGPQNEVAQAFEVVGIPKPILVGPNGIVLEVDAGLRGEGLITTLTNYLGK